MKDFDRCKSHVYYYNNVIIPRPFTRCFVNIKTLADASSLNNHKYEFAELHLSLSDSFYFAL